MVELTIADTWEIALQVRPDAPPEEVEDLRRRVHAILVAALDGQGRETWRVSVEARGDD